MDTFLWQGSASAVFLSFANESGLTHRDRILWEVGFINTASLAAYPAPGAETISRFCVGPGVCSSVAAFYKQGN